MSTLDSSRAAFVTGVLVVWIAATNAMLKYLRPAMRPWLLAAGVGLVVIGVYGLVRARSRAPHANADADADGHEHTHGRSRVGWLLVVPVLVVALFGPQAMGGYAVGRTPHLPPFAFDIAEYAHGTGQRTPELRMADVIEGAKQAGNRDYLLSHDVLLRGFVSVLDPAGPGSFVLTRYLMSCCAADAQPLSVTITGRPPGAGVKAKWYDVTARLTPAAPGKYGPVFAGVHMKAIVEPAGTYETLR